MDIILVKWTVILYTMKNVYWATSMVNNKIIRVEISKITYDTLVSLGCEHEWSPAELTFTQDGAEVIVINKVVKVTRINFENPNHLIRYNE